jgi:hypothetical protein
MTAQSVHRRLSTAIHGLSTSRESLTQRVLAKLDADVSESYRRMRGIVMLATQFASATIRRKGQSVPVLYLNALADAGGREVRETRWRAFIATTASLNQDLEDLERPVANDAICQARDELVRIVEENADLLA